MSPEREGSCEILQVRVDSRPLQTVELTITRQRDERGYLSRDFCPGTEETRG